MRQQLTPLAMAICALGLAHGAAQAQFKEPATVKIGFITDMSSEFLAGIGELRKQEVPVSYGPYINTTYLQRAAAAK